jgi:hypothetical protein
MILTGIIEAGLKIIEKVIPDPAARAEAQRKLIELEQAGQLEQLRADLQLAMGQLDVNKVEAASPNLFVSGWRPAVGWVCVLGLGYNFLAQPLLAWAALMALRPIPPTLQIGDLIVLLFGMLGLGTLRTVEKKAGV